MKNNNQELIKKNLFKVKKISIKNPTYKANGETEYELRNIGIAILVPAFNTYNSTFKEDRVIALTIDGSSIDIYQDYVVIENTRIMDSRVKEKLDNVIGEAKKIYEQQKKLVKHQKEYEKVKKSLTEKLNKNEEDLNKSFVQLKKSRGFLSNDEVIKHLNKKLNKNLKECSYSKNKFTFTISSDEYRGVCTHQILDISFNKDSISEVRITKGVDFGKWTADDYDFVFEEYDRTLHVLDLKDSSDFKKIKAEYFKSNTEASLKKAKAEEYFGASVGDKDSLEAHHIVCSKLNLECKKENLKEIESRINSLLVFV